MFDERLQESSEPIVLDEYYIAELAGVESVVLVVVLDCVL